MALISVIIPVFNLEDSIADCLQSVLQQTCQDYEVLIIDDGSTDNSVRICEDYIGNDPRFRIIRKENGGVSSARNIGLEMATGEYVAFVDGDDLCHCKMFEILLKGFQENTDIVLSRCSYANIRNGQRNFGDCDMSYTIFDSAELVNQILLEKADVGVWGGLFKRNLIGSIRFDTAIYFNEDKLFLCQYLLQNNAREKVAINSSRLYGYVMRKSSATHTPYNIKHISMIDSGLKILSEVEIFAPELKEAALFNLENARLNVLKIIAESRCYHKCKLDFHMIKKQTLESNSRIYKRTNHMQKFALKSGDIFYIFMVKIFRLLKP